MTLRRAPPALSWSLLLLAGCTTPDVVARRDCTGTDPAACESDRLGYCAGQGPPRALAPPGGGPSCSSAAVAAASRGALCLCEDYGAIAGLTTDGFDSAAGPYAPGGRGGAVATDGSLSTGQPLTIGDNLTVAGPLGIAASAGVTVRGSLASGGPLGGAGAGVDVGGDAQVNGDIQLASLRVAGVLTVPTAATIGVSGQNSVGSLVRGAVAVAAPCPCAAALDIPAFVAAARQSNDDAASGLDPDRLSGFSGDVTLPLPCGRYFLNRIAGDGAVTLRPTGRVALSIGGEVSLMRLLQIDLPAGSELDLFIDGRFDFSGPVALGSPDAPSRLRIYVSGTTAINLSAAATLAGLLYAPGAQLAASASLEAFGSLFLRRLSTDLPVSLHHDAALPRLGALCP